MSEIENDGWITVHPKLPQISDKVSDQLHRAFDDATKEPIPEHLKKLLDDLD
jgi:hypothetical protein